MVRISLAAMLSIVALIACDLSGAPTGEATDERQPTGQAPEATVEGTSTPDVIVPVPVSSVEIEGLPYQAYQMPGDPFRIVCQEPCPLDPQYIYAEYAGFRLAHARLIELTGIDTLAELQPVDMHLVLEDSICGESPWGHAYVYDSTHQAYTCTDGPGYYPTIQEKIEMASRLEGQYFPLHEYMHTIFFGRISGQAGDFQDYRAMFFHDYVVPLPSYAEGALDPAGFCSYRDPLAPGDFGGWLISELCGRNGFELADLALSLIELDALVQSGGGQVYEEGYEHPVPTVAQYRDILSRLLGSDTTDAFRAACWPGEFFGNSYDVFPGCAVESTGGTPTPLP